MITLYPDSVLGNIDRKSTFTSIMHLSRSTCRRVPAAIPPSRFDGSPQTSLLKACGGSGHRRPMSRPFEIKEIENLGRKSVIGVVFALARRPCIG
jgi:hypothetical protein